MQTHKNTNKRWQESELEYIKANYKRVSVSDIAEQLGRSEKATRNKVERLGYRLYALKRNKCKSPKPRYKRKYKGWHLDSYGRRVISVKGRGGVAEHRYLVEQRVGRRLTRKEQVHHINCDKTDNRPENLHLFPDAKSHLICHRSLEKHLKELMERDIIRFNSDKGRYEIC